MICARLILALGKDEGRREARRGGADRCAASRRCSIIRSWRRTEIATSATSRSAIRSHVRYLGSTPVAGCRAGRCPVDGRFSSVAPKSGCSWSISTKRMRTPPYDPSADYPAGVRNPAPRSLRILVLLAAEAAGAMDLGHQVRGCRREVVGDVVLQRRPRRCPANRRRSRGHAGFEGVTGPVLPARRAFLPPPSRTGRATPP
jgi:hypothetical protein